MTEISSAALLSKALAGGWRRSPPPLDLTGDELAEVAPLAVRAGVGGLVWRRLARAELRASEAGAQLQRAYYAQVVRNELHQRHLKRALEILGEAEIESVLVKGWALADLYPEPGLRPFGDIDLCVAAEDYRKADMIFQQPDLEKLDVDLHEGFGKFYERRTRELIARARTIDLDGVQVRVLAAEDSFRFLCLHLLRHGANRALWVCDIAAALESLPEGFDWKICFGDEPRQAEWVACAIGIAREFLGVEIGHVPGHSSALPEWVKAAVIKEWGRPFRFRLQIARRFRRPLAAINEIRHHWPNAIESTIALNGAFNDWPRFPFQIGHLGARIATYAVQSLGLVETPRARSRSGSK